MGRIKVRFNLSRGEMYMKWKVQFPTGEVKYLDPNKVRIEMIRCELKNSILSAKKIYEGGNKTVCSWVLCEILKVHNNKGFKDPELGEVITYNPRVSPNWLYKGIPSDGYKFDNIISNNNRLYNN